MDTITLDGSSGSVTIPGTEFYTDLGLNSDLFTITSTADDTVSITGQGWGHGIGMGQWGALGYAVGTDGGQGNTTWTQILAHYYKPAVPAILPTKSSPPRAGRFSSVAASSSSSRGSASTQVWPLLKRPGKSRSR